MEDQVDFASEFALGVTRFKQVMYLGRLLSARQPGK